MRLKNTILSILGTFFFFSAYGQHSMGTTQPNPSAVLDLTASNKGFLPPRISLTASNTLSPVLGTASTTHNGMIVFNTSSSTLNGLAGSGYYYWDGGSAGQWNKLSVSPTGTVSNSILRFTGTNWQETNSVLVGTAAVSITQDLTITASQTTLIGSTTLATTTLSAALLDSSGEAGTEGQVLSSTPSGTAWRNNVSFAPIINAAGQINDSPVLQLNGSNNVFIQESNAFVSSTEGMQIIDISNPTQPIAKGRYERDIGVGAFSVFVQGDYAYLAEGGDQNPVLRILDISDTNSPTNVGGIAVPNIAFVVVEGHFAYVVRGARTATAANQAAGLTIIDISDPNNPIQVGQLNDTTALSLRNAYHIQIQGKYAYVASFTEGVQVVDISNPTNPTPVSRVAPSDLSQIAGSYYLAVQGKYLYVTSYDNNRLMIFDTSNPQALTLVGELVNDSTIALGGASGVVVKGDYAYVVSYNDDSFQLIDISNSASPTAIGQLLDSEGSNLRLNGANNLFVQGNHTYVASLLDHGIQIVALGVNTPYGMEVGALNASSLQVDNYAQFNNALDIKGGLSVASTAKIDKGLSVAGATLVVNKSNNRVGIGTASPTQTFEVEGTARIVNNLLVGTDSALQEGTARLVATEAVPSLENFFPTNFYLINSTSALQEPSRLFDGVISPPFISFLLSRINTGEDWGLGYRFNRPFEIGRITFTEVMNSSVSITGRIYGGVFRLLLNGTLVYESSPLQDIAGTTSSKTIPNIVADEVQYVFPNGINNIAGRGNFYLGDFNIQGTTPQEGRLGIATANPTQALDVHGNARLTGQLFDANNTPGIAGQILSATASGTNWIDAPASAITLFSDDGTISSARTLTQSNNNLTFNTGTGDFQVGNATPTLFIDGSANRVGIGTNAPTQDLSVNGTAGKSGGGAWSTFSDRRIKKDIRDYRKGLKEILQIRPVLYDYNDKSPFKNDSDQPMVGIIAQEIQQVLPSTVQEIATAVFDDLLVYDSSELTYTQINALKELYALIEALQEQNKALEERLKRLEKKK